MFQKVSMASCAVVALASANVWAVQEPTGFDCRGGQGAGQVTLRALSPRHVTVAVGGVESDYYTVTQHDAPYLQLTSPGAGGFKLYLFTAKEMAAASAAGKAEKSTRVLEINGKDKSPQAALHLGEQTTTLRCERIDTYNEPRAQAFTDSVKRLVNAAKR
jgi:hypothetical protein